MISQGPGEGEVGVAQGVVAEDAVVVVVTMGEEVVEVMVVAMVGEVGVGQFTTVPLRQGRRVRAKRVQHTKKVNRNGLILLLWLSLVASDLCFWRIKEFRVFGLVSAQLKQAAGVVLVCLVSFFLMLVLLVYPFAFLIRQVGMLMYHFSLVSVQSA